MAHFFNEPSRTFSEYLLIPGYTSEECIPANVSLRTPLVKYRKGVEEPALSKIIRQHPRSFAIMSPVSEVMGNFKKLNPEGKENKDFLDSGESSAV